MPHAWTAKSDNELRRMAAWFAQQLPADRKQCERLHGYLGDQIAWIFGGQALDASSSSGRSLSNLRVVKDKPSTIPS
jgi:hypothetical protein